MIEGVVFYILSFIIIAMALMMVLSKNLVHSAVFMIMSFIGVAGIYLLLRADFLAAMQVLVYVGAISILLVFGIMLTRRGDIKESNQFNHQKWTAIPVCAGLFAIITYIVINTPFLIPFVSQGQSMVGPVADLMMTDFVVPFELAAILLLIGMIGAIIIARGGKQH